MTQIAGEAAADRLRGRVAEGPGGPELESPGPRGVAIGRDAPQAPTRSGVHCLLVSPAPLRPPDPSTNHGAAGLWPRPSPAACQFPLEPQAYIRSTTESLAAA